MNYEPHNENSTAMRVYSAILAVALGVVLAAALVHWWSM